MAHLTLHYKINPLDLEKEQIDDYLFHCKNLHKTPFDSFFKHTIFGLRAAYKVAGMAAISVSLPQIKRQNNLPVILSRREVKSLIESPKHLKHRLVIGLCMVVDCGIMNSVI